MAQEVTYKNISPAELAGQDLHKFTMTASTLQMLPAPLHL